MSDIGWGIIGVPNGFQHISEGITANSAISAVDNRLCIEDYEKESLYAVIYDTAIIEGTNNRQLMVYFVQYNFSKETGKDRSGSFYGSYIALPGRVPVNLDCCKNIIDILKKLSDYNKSIYIENNKFVRDYTSVFEFPNLEKEIEKVINNTDKAKLPAKKIDNKKDVVVYENNPSEVFLNSIELYDIYSRIYISNNEGYCRHINEGSNTNYKESSDLKKESFDIVEARRIEQDRIERYNREMEEKRIREKEQAEREEQERIRVHEEDVQNLFQDMGILFLFSENNMSLVELIEEYKAGNYTFQQLKETYEALDANANEAKRVSNIFEERKLELLAELKKIRGFDQRPKTELKIATEAAEGYQNLKPTISPIKVSNNFNKVKAQGSRVITPNYDNSQLDTNGFSIKYIIILISVIVTILVIITSIYFFFFYEDFDSSQSSLTPTTYQDINIDGTDTSAYQDSNEDLDIDTEYKQINWESTIGSSSSALNSSGECKYDEKNIRHYTVTQTDIMNYDQLRSDSEIISQIMESILLREKIGDISNVDRAKFKQILIECNESLNFEKYNSVNPNSNLLPIKPDDLVNYVSVIYLK